MKTFQICLLSLTLGCAASFGQAYNGFFDTAGCGAIGGWAWDGTNNRINVDIYDAGVYVTSAPANQYRADLLGAGIGDGYHAFSIAFPSALKDNRIHDLYARFGGTTINLATSPRALQCASSSTGYTYYYSALYTASPYNYTAANWTANGSIAGGNSWGLATSSGGGSLISKYPVGGPSSTQYEVNMTLTLNASGGVYVEYLRATSNALTGTGSYFSVELQNPTFNSAGICTATLAAYQSISSVVTQLISTPVACHDGMQVRTALAGNSAQITVNNNPYTASFSSQLSSGMPGIGGRSMPSNNAIAMAELGPHDATAPAPVNANTFTPWITAGMVHVEWQGAVDDSNGTGVAFYAISRVGGPSFLAPAASFSDTTVQASTTYTYQIQAVDYHWNASAATNFVVTTPASGSTPNDHGHRPTNSYWGAAGEEIDIYGGNLNYSVPLITSIGRGGLTAAFNLTYNSQNWVVTNGTTSFIQNADVGYGFGWQLMLGSIMPMVGPSGSLEYWYTNASGAQFRMVIDSNGVWTGNGSFYAWYDSNTNRLWFRDGSFWLMGCVSAGGEPDAGTMYPTLVEDSNGNQIIIHYMAGAGANWNDSSARIASIEDARAVSYTDPGTGETLYHSYSFSYSTGGNGLQYLSSITSYVGTPETYSFNISQGQGLYSPTGVSFGTTSLMDGITFAGLGYTYTFTYDTGVNGLKDGDLLQVQFPQGGHLRWAYTNCTYPGPATIREVQYRYLLSNTQNGEDTYTFTPGNKTSTTLDDPTGAERYWAFSGSWLTDIKYRASHGAAQAVRHEYYTWVQDPASLNYYLGTLKTVLDEGQSYTQTTQSVQTQDSYGNVLTTQVYDYGNLSTPARTYSNTYLYQNNTNYSSRYIYNRLLTSTLTSASPNITLVSNTYDGYTLSSPGGTPGPREWDVVNYPASFTYRGNVTQSASPGKTTNTYYDATGTVTSQNDNNGHTVSVATSAATNFTLPDTLTPNGTTSLQTSAAYNLPNFLPASVAGPGQTLNNGTSGTAAYTAYDSYGRVSSTLAPSQSTSAMGAQTSYTYSYTSGAWTIHATTANSSGGNHWTTSFLDGIGRTAAVQAGDNTTTVSEVDTTYAPCACGPVGKTSWQSQPYAPPNSSPPGTAYSYDALGRTSKVLLADGASATNYTYQGNATTVTDPDGNWKQYLNDATGNLVTVIEPDPTVIPVNAPPNPPPAYPVTSVAAGYLLTSYTYDQLNHLTQVSMPRGTANGPYTQTRTFAYDPATQRLTSATNPENRTVSYTYNADGTLATKRDANGNTESYTYDAYQRLTGIPDRQQTFTYDTCPANDSFCVSAPGRMVEAVFGSMVGPNQLTFQYDYRYTPAGKVTSKMLTLQSANNRSMWNVDASGSLTASYTYDNQGAVTSMVYPTAETWAVSSNQTFTYTLDAMERPTGLTDNLLNRTWATGAAYNAANQPLNDGTATRTYNSLLQITNFAGMTYNYSTTKNNGQITSSVDAPTGEAVTYQYDALKRLVYASGTNWVENYTYDGFGNMIQMAPTGTTGAPSLSTTVDATTNRLTPTGVRYDNNGNLSVTPAGVYGYDAGNRMVEVMQGVGNFYYIYDSDNRRVYYRDVNNNEIIYFYGADGKKLATYTSRIITYDGNPAIQLTQQSENVYFLGKLINAEGNGVTTDRLGSVRNGGGTGYQAQYPYGVEYTATVNDREKYATYTRDSLTGFDYAMNRYYSSQWGRFLSPDPYMANSNGPGNPKDPLSWNKYVYTGDDPVNRYDPAGLLREIPTAGNDENGGGVWMIDDSGDRSGGSGSGGGGGPRPKSAFPKCNPTNDPLTEKKLRIVTADYNPALSEATAVTRSVASSALSAGALATMFVQWSMWESGYSNDTLWLQHFAEHNYFGEQQPFRGSVPCPSNRFIPPNSKNACFPSSLTWGQELANALNATSKGVPYLSALESALPTGSVAADLQAIANNGWNLDPTYGARITGGIHIQSLIDCAITNGYMRP